MRNMQAIKIISGSRLRFLSNGIRKGSKRNVTSHVDIPMVNAIDARCAWACSSLLLELNPSFQSVEFIANQIKIATMWTRETTTINQMNNKINDMKDKIKLLLYVGFQPLNGPKSGRP